MPRQVRIEYEVALYHFMARGNRRNRIFASPDGGDEALFLKTLGVCCERSDFRVWAWVLMGNHYQLLVETPSGNLVAGMNWLQNTCTRRCSSCRPEWGGHHSNQRSIAIVSSLPMISRDVRDR